VTDDPTSGLSEAELWAFVSQLHADHGDRVGEVFVGMFRDAMRATDRAGYERWSRLLEMLEALNGPEDPSMLH
jgi:hypothetical protein